MATHTVRVVCIVLCMFVVLFLLPNHARAERMPPSVPRIRVESRHLRAELAHVIDRSPTLRSIVRQIEESDVIVHVTCERFASVMLDGRTVLGSASPDVRYVRVQIDCMLPEQRLVTILGHEFQHVAEIAAAPDVVDPRSFARLFKKIGYSCGTAAREAFETAQAIDAGDRVRREYLDGWPVGASVVSNARSGVPLQ
jgi:uncharacterized protein YkvS